MLFLKNIVELENYLESSHCQIGCLGDTSFLYSFSFDDDRLYSKSLEVFDILADAKMPIYANVVSRMEFVDLIFRKHITEGAIELLNKLDTSLVHKKLYTLLKYIRDQNTAHKRNNLSYKIDESRLKKLRQEIEGPSSPLNGESSARCHDFKSFF